MISNELIIAIILIVIMIVMIIFFRFRYYEKLIESGIGIGIERDNPKSLEKRSIAYLDVSDFEAESAVCAYYRKESYYGNVEQFLQFISQKDYL